MADCVDFLKEWTGKAIATIIYDSTADEFTDGGLFNKVKDKQNIAIIGFTTDGDVFGGFYSVAVTKQEKRLLRPELVCLLVRVARAVRDTADVSCEGGAEEGRTGVILQE